MFSAEVFHLLSFSFFQTWQRFISPPVEVGVFSLILDKIKGSSDSTAAE